jgi:hypothetical protein
LTPAHRIKIPRNVLIFSLFLAAKLIQLCSISILTKPVRPVCITGQIDICVQKPVLATQNSSIISSDHLFVPEDLNMCCICLLLRKISKHGWNSSHSIKGQRRVDVMSTLVKEAQATLLLKGSPRG